MHSRRERYLGNMAGSSDRSRLKSAARACAGSGAIITTHDVPDVDGLGASFALQRALNRRGVKADIVTGPTIHLTDPLVESLGIRMRRWEEIPESDIRPLIVVDTNTPALLSGAWRRKNQLLLVVDHHQRSADMLKPEYLICNEAAASASEIIASLVDRKDLDGRSALALAVGIAGDSERLNDAEIGTLCIFQSLLRMSGASKKAIDELAYPDLPASSVAAILEEMKHVEVELYGGKVIAVAASRLENPAILANEIRDMNASVVAVLSEQTGGWYRISFRVRFKEARRNGIHANEIARIASEACGMPEGMRGGGHIDKAGAMIRGGFCEISRAIFDAAKLAIDAAAGKQ